MQIKYHSNLASKSFLLSNSLLVQNLKNWHHINKEKEYYFDILSSESLIIYPYSLSSNFLQEVFNKLGLNIVLTNDIKQAHIVIGLKSYLRQNFKLKKLAQQKKIPIYSFNQISIYQLTKFIKLIF